MKILLFGKDGQVGWELQRSLAPLGELLAPGRHDEILCGDLSRLEDLAATVRQVRPQVVVNAAAYTDVDKAQAEAAVAHTVNALAPGVLAQAAAAVDALLVHYSTDYVFDGSGTRAWMEDDPTGPLNVYGQTKLEGERLVAAHCARYIVLRTSWIYSARGSNFARTVLRLGAERERLAVIDDQYGAPTGADLLADVTAHAIRAVLADPARAGIYHVAAAGETTWNAYARFVVEQAVEAGLPLKVSVEAVDRLPTSAFPMPARRPHNSRLDTRKLQVAFGFAMPPWQSGVSRMFNEVS